MGDVQTSAISQADPLAVALGYVNWAYHPAAIATQQAFTSQTIYAQALYLPPGTAISLISLVVGTAAVGTTPTGFFVGIASPTTMLAQSANLATSASLTTLGRQTFACSYTPSLADSANGLYYVLALLNGAFGTTQPQFGRGAGLSGTGTALAAHTPLIATAGTGQTALPANGAVVTYTSAGASAAPAFWCGLS